MIGKLMNWFIEPFKPSFKKEIQGIQPKKKYLFYFKWGFFVIGYMYIGPYYFLMIIPALFSLYFLSFVFFVSLIALKLSHNPDIVIDISRWILFLSYFLAISIGRRIGRHIYRDVYEKHGIKGLPDERSIWEMIKNFRKK